VAEAAHVLVRMAVEADLPALEWEGQYRRFRRVYRHAYSESRKGRRLLLVAEFGGLVVGQVFVQFTGLQQGVDGASRTAYMHAFRVRPEYRNLGIGTQLVREAESLLRARDIRRVQIAVAKENQGARRLYERLGYTIIGEDPGEWSFVDDGGNIQHVHEPSFLLERAL